MNPYLLNKEIEKFISHKDQKQESYSKKDIEYIQQYSGYGGQGSKGAKGEGVLYEFFTPHYVCKLMYELAVYYGYDGGQVLEPSIATGNIIKPFPDKKKITAFELNHYSKRIAEITYPEILIYEGHFEKAFLKPPRYTSRIPAKELTWLNQSPFSLVIGNPPYGKYKNMYSSYFRTPKMNQTELFFMYYGLLLLKKGGLLIYLTSSNFLRNGISYNSEKENIGQLATLLDAYRLPPVFKNSQVPTDIIILKKK